VTINWIVVFNKLFTVIDGVKGEDHYFSGPRFIAKVQEVWPECPNYGDLMSGRANADISTTRRDYFKDLFMRIDEDKRFTLTKNILEEVHIWKPKSCDEILVILGGGVAAPFAAVPAHAWNGDRLNDYLKSMDAALQNEDLERAVTLAYTCLEGFFKAFVRKNIPEQGEEHEIVALSKVIRDFLKSSNGQYPDEVLNLVTQTAHAVNRTRDRFSESHFGEEPDRWIAMYIRDIVNTQIRLLLHFM
jgi:hypothetical protein